MSHLQDENDLDYDDCHNALKLAILHTSAPQMASRLEKTILSSFPNEEKLIGLTTREQLLYRLAVEFVTKGRSDFFKNNITIFINEMINFKESIKKGFELMEEDLVAKKISKKKVNEDKELPVFFTII